jgi:hypothetical protein
MGSVYFKPCTLSQVSRRYSWKFHANSKSASQFLCNRSDRPLKASRHPAVSRRFKVEDIQMSGQHRPDTRSSFSNFYTEFDFYRHLFGKFLQDVRTTWQHVRTLPNIPEYFGFPLWMRKGVTVKIVRTLGQIVRTWSSLGRIVLFYKGGWRNWGKKSIVAKLNKKVMFCSRSHPSGHHGNTSGRSSEFDKKLDFLHRYRYGKTAASVRTTGQHRLDAILDKARRGEELQPSGHNPYYGIYVQQKCSCLDARATPPGHGPIMVLREAHYGKPIA